ncbi:hypothetical protein WMF38_57765 [Sorangium sp. So ce118]
MYLTDAERRDMRLHSFRRSAHMRLRRLSAQDLRAEVVARMATMNERQLRVVVEAARRLG